MLCFCGIFYFGDVALDRMAGDWFERQFFYTDCFTVFKWEAFKNFIFRLAIYIISAWGISVIAAIIVCQRQTQKQTAQKAKQLAKQYFSRDDYGIDDFPIVYHELSEYLMDLKTQVKHSEQMIKDEAAKKNDLIAYLAHDLKTPLTSVVGYLSLLEEVPDMPTEQKAKYVHIALDKSLRLEQLINEFFEITRYNLHEMVLERENVDLSYMLMQMADEFYPVLMDHGNMIYIDVGESLTVIADADKLARVFNNILKNAVAYSDGGSVIELRAQQQEGVVRVTISNHGRTIPKQKLQSIFEKFYRLDDARSSNTGGAGLGLAIAKEIVTLHGGTITAESENQVTTFTVELPN